MSAMPVAIARQQPKKSPAEDAKRLRAELDQTIRQHVQDGIALTAANKAFGAAGGGELDRGGSGVRHMVTGPPRQGGCPAASDRPARLLGPTPYSAWTTRSCPAARKTASPS